MAAVQLGRGRCPLCNDNRARVSLSKNGYAVLTCAAHGCGLQLFTRSEGADEKVRDLIVSTPADPPPAPAPANPPPAPKAPPAPAPADPAPATASQTTKPAWGALSW